jgi:hypothetical protein
MDFRLTELLKLGPLAEAWAKAKGGRDRTRKWTRRSCTCRTELRSAL